MTVEARIDLMCKRAADLNTDYHGRRAARPNHPRGTPARAPGRRAPRPPQHGPPDGPGARVNRRQPWRPPQYDPEEASRLQRLYRTNRDRAVRDILDDNSPPCDVPADRLTAHFAPPVPNNPALDEFWAERPDAVPDIPPIPHSPHLSRPITRPEVTLRLNRASNTAPGADGLRYAAWRALDPESHLLTRVFELCRLAQRVPASWKHSESVLLHKGGDADLAASWRPIALSLTVAKLYAGVWADRLETWAEAGDALSPCQKGFRRFDGVLEHNFVLQCAINNARRSGNGCQVAFIDLTNAFGSIPHHLIWTVLTRLGLPPEILATIQDLYRGSSTSFRTTGGLSDPVPTLSGVRQGCPLSGLLFNLSMEPLLRTMSTAEIELLAFADDLALILPDAHHVRRALTLLESVCRWCGLCPNPAKSGLLSIRQPAPEDALLCDQPLPPVPEGAAYRYLGRQVGHTRLSMPPLDVLAEVRLDAERLCASALAPWQKLDAIRTFIVPRLTHCLRLGLLPKAPLHDLDAALRWRVKGLLNIPNSATGGYLYGPTSAGCVGLTCLADEADILMVSASAQLLRSRDPRVAELASAELRGVVRRRTEGQGAPTDEQLSGYLNGDRLRDGGDVSSRFTRARVSTVTLARRVAVSWRPANPTPVLHVGTQPVLPSQEAKTLRGAVRQRALADLIACPHQGKVMECVAPQRVSSHYMYDGSFTRFAEWRFVHRARLGLVPLNAYGRGARDQRCRRCGYARETLPHVLNHCLTAHRDAIQRRHDAILTRLEKAVPRGRDVAVLTNRQVPGIQSPLRPDLVVVRGDHVSLVDVTVSFENRLDALSAADLLKREKYAGIVQQLRQQGKQASVHAFVVGSLGTWYRGNEAALRQLRVSRVYSRLMRKLIVSDTLRWSRDLYVEHVTGHRQYEPVAAGRPVGQ